MYESHGIVDVSPFSTNGALMLANRPDTITRIPRVSDSATFSAACRHTLQVRNKLSPSFHSPVELSRNLGVEATRNRATG